MRRVCVKWGDHKGRPYSGDVVGATLGANLVVDPHGRLLTSMFAGFVDRLSDCELLPNATACGGQYINNCGAPMIGARMR
jgi:hypothetical protein